MSTRNLHHREHRFVITGGGRWPEPVDIGEGIMAFDVPLFTVPAAAILDDTVGICVEPFKTDGVDGFTAQIVDEFGGFNYTGPFGLDAPGSFLQGIDQVGIDVDTGLLRACWILLRFTAPEGVSVRPDEGKLKLFTGHFA